MCSRTCPVITTNTSALWNMFTNINKTRVCGPVCQESVCGISTLTSEFRGLFVGNWLCFISIRPSLILNYLSAIFRFPTSTIRTLAIPAGYQPYRLIFMNEVSLFHKNGILRTIQPDWFALPPALSTWRRPCIDVIVHRSVNSALKTSYTYIRRNWRLRFFFHRKRKLQATKHVFLYIARLKTLYLMSGIYLVQIVNLI